MGFFGALHCLIISVHLNSVVCRHDIAVFVLRKPLWQNPSLLDLYVCCTVFSLHDELYGTTYSCCLVLFCVHLFF